jgi:Zn-dependent protease
MRDAIVFLFEPDQTRFDLRWRMFGTPIRVHPMFWLMSLILGYDATIRAGIGYVLAWVGCVLFSVLLHEFGHVWMGQLFGSHGYIVLYGFGGLAVGSNQLSARGQRILVSFAGPVIQLLLLALIWFSKDAVTPLIPVGSRRAAALVWSMLFEINLLWPVLNLLPIWPLDGGQITREVCQGTMRFRGLAISLGISMVVSGLLAVHEFMATQGRPLFRLPFLESGALDITLFNGTMFLHLPLFGSGSIFMAIFFAMFCISSFQALRAENERRRDWGDDDWR